MHNSIVFHANSSENVLAAPVMTYFPSLHPVVFLSILFPRVAPLGFWNFVKAFDL